MQFVEEPADAVFDLVAIGRTSANSAARRVAAVRRASCWSTGKSSRNCGLVSVMTVC
ncbi:hypothetical protein [Micromonospora coerulea]|uniref:hypothetical protein n=1 Tax=Micromonospora coerulea TaxID=47856 RepID=UPI0031F9B79B